MIDKWTLFAVILLILVIECGCGKMETKASEQSDPITIFMCGDVMTGRGVDQILPNPSDQTLHESYMKRARGYVEIAEQVNGPIKYPVDWAYIWGDALAEFKRFKPDLKLINLETSITTSNDYWVGKGINYRMNPANIQCLTAAGIDICALANNHVIDWGYAGLTETLATLHNENIMTAGAGIDKNEAEAPAVMDISNKRRILVFSYGSETSGIPWNWRASYRQAGVNLLPDLSNSTVKQIQKQIAQVKRPGDIVIASIHWGGNWGYTISSEHKRFARMLIDNAGVDLIHGHSSHHVIGIEVYKGKLILYGCGDFINDYEGIGSHQEYRGDLSLMYFADIDSQNGSLIKLTMVPMQTKRFQVKNASQEGRDWLFNTSNREGKKFNTQVIQGKDNTLSLEWSK